MRVRTHPDPTALERALLDRLERAVADDVPTLVVVPASRLRDHVQRRLLDRGGASIGIEILTLPRLVDAALEAAGRSPGAPIARPALELLAGEALATAGDRWARFVERRPRALQRLTESLVDLREAAIAPGVVERAARGGRQRELAAIYAHWSAALDRARERGFSDVAGKALEACDCVDALLGSDRAVVLYGAYDLIGTHLLLLRAIDRLREVEVLAPGSDGAPAYAYADAFIARYLGAPERLAEPAAGPRPALTALFDEQRPPGQPFPIALANARGAAAELRRAVVESLAAVREGTPPEEIAIVARRLEPFAGAIEQEIVEAGLPADISLQRPLLRAPVVQDFLTLLRAVDDDFPRRATIDVLRSPRLRVAAVRWDRADRLSRRYGLIGGIDEWRALARRERAELDSLVEGLEALAGSVASQTSWSRFATSLLELFDRVVVDPESEPARALRELASGLADLDALLSSARPTRRRAIDQLARAIAARTLPVAAPSRGIAVLDAMQARGLTHRRVRMIALNAGQFPMHGPDDPLLTSGWRRRIAEDSGLPLASGRDPAEERLIFALALGGARETLGASWQRADEAGRARTPSLIVRELARLSHGRADLARALSAAVAVPSHPEQLLADEASRFELLAPRDARLLDALRTPEDRRDRFVERHGAGEWGAAVAMLDASQAFRPGDGRFDGRIGATDLLEERWSVSDWERLGRCPLQFLLRCVAGIRELDDEPDPLELSPRRLGDAVHRFIERLYGNLIERGRFGAAPAGAQLSLFDAGEAPIDQDAVRAEALAWVDEHRASILGELGEALQRRVPTLWSVLSARWLDAVRALIETDFDEFRRSGYHPTEVEQTIEFELGRARLRGRLDRELGGSGGARIDDFKTSRKVQPRVSPSGALKLVELQAPLYWLARDRAAPVTLIGVHPDPAAPDRTRATFDGFKKPEQADRFDAALEVLDRMVADGRFPLRPDKHCDYCDVRGACRRRHPPTLERDEHDPAVADYFEHAPPGRSS